MVPDQARGKGTIGMEILRQPRCTGGEGRKQVPKYEDRLGISICSALHWLAEFSAMGG